MTVDIPEAAVFELGDVYGYRYRLNRKYQGVPFALMDNGRIRCYQSNYSPTGNEGNAYVADADGVNAWICFQGAERLIKLGSGDKILGITQAAQILEERLASQLNLDVESAGMKYFQVDFQVDFQGKEQPDEPEHVTLPCWEFLGTNRVKGEGLAVYVDVFTGQIYYYARPNENE